MAVEILFRLLEPWPVKIVLDSVSHSLGATLRRSPLSVEASAEVLLLCAGAVVVICLIRAVAGYGTRGDARGARSGRRPAPDKQCSVMS